MNNDNSTFEFEGRTYINPDVSRDEQTAFIDTLRDIQAQNNAQIETETHNLGTDVEPRLGGLTGSEEYWKGLYQTPQTNAAVANMKAVAQQTALNDALSNYQNMLQNRYNQAYRDYQRRAYNYSRRSSGSNTSTSDTGGGDGNDGTGNKYNINNNLSETTQDVSTTNYKSRLGKINTTDDGKLYYLDASPTKEKTPLYLGNLTSELDMMIATGKLKPGYNGERRVVNGESLIYLDTGQFAPSWYRVSVAPVF